MADRQSQCVIVTEDLQSEVFLRRFLMKVGFEERRIRRVTHSKGAGSGEQFVRDRYPIELKAFRSKRYLALKLFVMVDADSHSVEERRRQLAASLASNGLNSPTDDEHVSLLIPRRNIETWIHHLSGQTVDEATTYPKLDREGACQPGVDRLVAIFRSGEIPGDCPDSLRRAIEELKRVL